MSDQTSTDLREEVRSRYAAAARAVLEPQAGVTARAAAARPRTRAAARDGAAEAVGGFSEDLYREGETDGLPEEAVLASLGCGNPIAVADLHEGERVLDLGSGGGIDVLLSARRVGPSGFAYGVDMTDEMLTLARANAAKAGAGNVEFVKGEIEDLPLPDQAVDVVISNCVINLSTDKPAVLAEMFRVLVSGRADRHHRRGRRGPHEPADRAAAGSYVGCIAGALSRSEYLDGLTAAGFTEHRSPSPPRRPRACTRRSSGPSSPPPPDAPSALGCWRLAGLFTPASNWLYSAAATSYVPTCCGH